MAQARRVKYGWLLGAPSKRHAPRHCRREGILRGRDARFWASSWGSGGQSLVFTGPITKCGSAYEFWRSRVHGAMRQQHHMGNDCVCGGGGGGERSSATRVMGVFAKTPPLKYQKIEFTKELMHGPIWYIPSKPQSEIQWACAKTPRQKNGTLQRHGSKTAAAATMLRCAPGGMGGGDAVCVEGANCGLGGGGGRGGQAQITLYDTQTHQILMLLQDSIAKLT